MQIAIGIIIGVFMIAPCTLILSAHFYWIKHNKGKDNFNK
jgi:hypothetical protein